jgi:Transposase DDE domain
VVGAWLADRPGQQQRRRAVAVDGKTLRGAKRDCRQVHLLACMDHATRAVLAQRQVNGAPGEVPAFQPLLAGLDLTDAVVTADALHTHADAAEFLVTSKQAQYLLVVKANQPTLLDRCAGLPWHDVPSWTAPATRRTAGSNSAPSRPSPSAGSPSRTPRRSSRSPARPATLAPGGGGPWSSTRSPASPSPRPAPPAWPTGSVATGPSRSVKQTAPMECDR